MNLKTLLVSMIFIFSIFCCQSINANESVDIILHVGGFGPGNYSKIQDAINDSKDGDIIFVHNGIYDEELYVDKSISLIGEDELTTIVDSGGEGDVVLLKKNGIYLSKFTLKNGGQGHNYSDDAAIEILADDIIIDTVICIKVNYGVWVRESENISIINSTFTCLYDNIWLFKSKYCILKNNILEDASIVLDGYNAEHFIHDIDINNTVNGKPVYYYLSESNCIVPQNAGQIILVNCIGFIIEDLDISNVTDCVELFYSTGNTIRNNYFHDTIDFGVRMVHSNSNSVINNIFVNIPIAIGLMSGGIWIENMGGYCYKNIIKNNLIKDSWYYGIYIDQSNQNMFLENYFINNGWKSENGNHILFADSFLNKWSGNYYDDWVGLKYPLLKWTPKIIKGIRHLYKINQEKYITSLAFDFNPST